MRLLLVVLLLFQVACLWAHEYILPDDRLFRNKDSLRAEFIISCYDIKLDSIEKAPLHKSLPMSERMALRKAKKILRENKGSKFTYFNKPLFRYKLRGYWIVSNAETIRMRKGGGFMIVMNSYSWALVTLIYGK